MKVENEPTERGSIQFGALHQTLFRGNETHVVAAQRMHSANKVQKARYVFTSMQERGEKGQRGADVHFVQQLVGHFLSERIFGIHLA
jgi:hypothetical protein